MIFFGSARNGDRVRLEAGAGGMPGFELTIEDECGEGEFLGRQAEGGAKEDFSRPARCQGQESHAFFKVSR
jgi:hypothetical protein